MAHVANTAIKEDVIDFELTKNKLLRNSGVRLIGQGDNLGDVFGVRIFQDGVAFNLAGYSVQGYFIRQNGTTVLINGSAVNGNVAIVTLPQACYVYEGPFSLAIKIVGTITETLRVIDGVVTKTTTETMIDPGSVVPDISQLLAKIQQMEQATAAANTAANNANNVATNIIAPAYSTSATYAVGNYCIYNGYLYRCTTAIATAEEWTAAHWTNVKLGDDVVELKSAINNIQGDIKPINEYDKIRGNINSSGNWTSVTSGSSYCYFVPITPGDSLKITSSATVTNIYAFLKSNTAPVQGAAADFSVSYPARIQPNKGTVNNYDVPADAHILYIYESSVLPSIEINGINLNTPYNQLFKETYTRSKTNEQDINDLETTTGSIIDTIDYMTVGAYQQTQGFINSSGIWSNINSSYLHIAIPVKSGDRVLIIGNNDFASYFAFLRTYSTPVSGTADFSTATGFTERIQSTKGGYNWYDVPSDTHFLIVQLLTGGDNDTPEEIRINNVNYSVSIAGNLRELYRPIPVNWCALGDSITASYHSEFVDGQSVTSTDDRENIVWTYLVSKINKWRLTNKAIGGTGYLDECAGRRAWKLARDTDFTPYNLVTISYGINDWKGDCVMGTVSDDGSAETPTTVMQAMKATIEAIMASNPNCKIIVITPMNCYGYSKDYGNKSTNYGLGYTFTNSGTLDSFCSKLIEVCNYYGIQYIDMTHYSPINRENLPTMVPDGVHPSIECHNMIAHQLSKQITF